jgi:hypothetical protein
MAPLYPIWLATGVFTGQELLQPNKSGRISMAKMERCRSNGSEGEIKKQEVLLSVFSFATESLLTDTSFFKMCRTKSPVAMLGERGGETASSLSSSPALSLLFSFLSAH